MTYQNYIIKAPGANKNYALIITHPTTGEQLNQLIFNNKDKAEATLLILKTI